MITLGLWSVVWCNEDVTAIHTYPVADLIEHELIGEDCPCGPTPEAVVRGDGSVGWLMTHHSLDGRERRER